MPPKVRKLKFVGAALNKIGETVLKGVQSPVLVLEIKNTTITALPDNLFKNLENIRNITLDVDFMNKKLTKISNPNSANFPNEPSVAYLNQLDVAGLELACTCDLG